MPPVPPSLLSVRGAALLELFLAQLSSNSDAYVYLAALEGLRALAIARGPGATLPRLLREYTAPDAPVRTKLKLAEGVVGALAVAFESGTLPRWASDVVAAVSVVGVRGWRLQEGAVEGLRRAVGTSTSTPAAVVPPAAALVAAARGMLGDDDDNDDSGTAASVPFVYNASLALADVCELRVSALTCLGDTLAHAGVALPEAVLRDALSGLEGILRMERGNSSSGARVATTIAAEGAAAGVSEHYHDSDLAEARLAAEALISACCARVRRASALALRAFIDGCGGGARALASSPSAAPSASAPFSSYRRDSGDALQLHAAPPVATASPMSAYAAVAAATRLLPIRNVATAVGGTLKSGAGPGDMLSRSLRMHVPALYSVLRYPAETDPDAITRAHANDALVAAEAVAESATVGALSR